MNILAVDFGTKRIGLAWAQEGLDVVLPYGVIESEKKQERLSELVKLVRDENIGKAVFGLPFGENREENDNTRRIRAFAEDFKKESGIQVEFIGEEFTTKEAEAMGGETSLDEKSAMLILQSCLKRKR